MLPLGVEDIEGMNLKKGGRRDGGVSYVRCEDRKRNKYTV